MLVLGRHEQESVVIDLTEHGLGLIKVYVVAIQETGEYGVPYPKVRLGFEADKRITINRSEIYKALAEAKA